MPNLKGSKLQVFKALFICMALDCLLIFSLCSCSQYTGVKSSEGCGVWYGKKFEKAKQYRAHRSPKFGRY